MRHDAGELALDGCGLNHAAVEVRGSARQRECIDLPHIDGLEGVSELAMLHVGGHHLYQAPADSIHEGLDVVFPKKRQLLLDFFRRLLAKLDILRRRVLVLGWRDARLGDCQRDRHREDSGDAQKTAAGTLSVKHHQQAP